MQTRFTPDQKAAYIAAFIDAEGHVLCKLATGRQKLERALGFCNSDKELFDTVCGMIEDFGFSLLKSCRLSRNAKHSDRWDAKLKGGKEAYKRFFLLIPLQHPGKKKRLEEIVRDYEQTEAAGRQRRFYRRSRWSNSSTSERAAHSLMMREAIKDPEMKERMRSKS